MFVGCFFRAQPHSSVPCCAFPSCPSVVASQPSSKPTNPPPNQSREDVPIQLCFFFFVGLLARLPRLLYLLLFSFICQPAAWATPLPLQPHTKNTHTRKKMPALPLSRLFVHLLAPVLVVVTVQNKGRAANRNRRLLLSSFFPLPARHARSLLPPPNPLLNSTSSCRPSWHRRWPCPRWRGDPRPPTCGSSPPGQW